MAPKSAVIKEMLPALVRQKILSPSEASTLGDACVPTYSPGSAFVRSLITDCTVDSSKKDDWALKSVRAGSNHGHIFGVSSSQEGWLAALSKTSQPRSPGAVGHETYALQKLIRQVPHDIVLIGSSDVEPLMLVGTFYIRHGEFCGVGPWRTTNETRHMAFKDGNRFILQVAHTRDE